MCILVCSVDMNQTISSHMLFRFCSACKWCPTFEKYWMLELTPSICHSAVQNPQYAITKTLTNMHVTRMLGQPYLCVHSWNPMQHSWTVCVLYFFSWLSRSASHAVMDTDVQFTPNVTNQCHRKLSWFCVEVLCSFGDVHLPWPAHIYLKGIKEQTTTYSQVMDLVLCLQKACVCKITLVHNR